MCRFSAYSAFPRGIRGPGPQREWIAAIGRERREGTQRLRHRNGRFASRKRQWPRWACITALEFGAREEHLHPVPPDAARSEGAGIVRQYQDRDEDVLAQHTAPFEERRSAGIGAPLEAVAPADAQELGGGCGTGEPGIGAAREKVGETGCAWDGAREPLQRAPAPPAHLLCPADRRAVLREAGKLLVPDVQLDDSVVGVQPRAVCERNLPSGAGDHDPERAIGMRAVLVDAVDAS